MMDLLTISNLLAWSSQVAILIAAALLTLSLLRLGPADVRYGVLRIVLAVCLVLPLLQPRVGVTLISNGTSATSEEGFELQAVERTDAKNLPHPALQVTSVPWRSSLAVVLCVGGFARLMWIGAGIVRLRRLRRAGEAAPARHEQTELQELINTHAEIRYVAGLGQPVTFGFRNPVVLLPESLLAQPEAIQRAVLAHELWHVRRRDWIWTVAEEGVRAILWFHPAIWILLSHIQRTREEVVDQLTILTIGSRRSYADALLAFADAPPLFGASTSASASAFAHSRHLVRRMALISKEVVMSARCVVVCCAVLATALLGTTRYAVQAFPLLRPVDTANQDALGPGPVERRAKPITPENPVPRRTYYVPPDLPSEAEAIGARGMVMVRITLDETGQIAETRIVGLSVNLGDRGSVSTSNPAGVNLEAALNSQVRLSPETSSQSLRPALQTTIEAVLRAVRQWQYAPPADGPIAFSVTVPVGSTAAIPPPPPPPPPSDSSSWEGAQGALRVGGTIQPPAKIRNVAPIYPPDAMAARVQGVVILEVRVEADGRVGQARILRSIPLLDDAALDAVRQWEFTPTLINGQAVPVLMTTTINFTMQ